MKEWLKKWRNPLLIGAIAFLLCFGATLALLTDTESKNNVVVLGNVKVKLTEDPYEDEQTVVPGQVIAKPPVIHNTGKNDAYVFVELSMPKAKVQMLYEEDFTDSNGIVHKAGTLKDTQPAVQEIFRTLISDTTKTYVTNTPDIQYNKAASAQGWEFLGFGDNTNSKRSYWFGYNCKLSGKDGDNEDITSPLFNSVQLKSFIDEDIDDDIARSIGVNVFAIQADNLELFATEPEFLTQAQLQDILKVIQNKKTELGEINYE